jgi:hypothetical protein
MIIWSIWRKWSRKRDAEREAVQQSAEEQLRAGDDPAAVDVEQTQRVIDAGTGADAGVGEELAPPANAGSQPEGD